tara:strand:+ start:567 stop:746 length:180 start_codon:yes stop_codon:yes gene_type:complete
MIVEEFFAMLLLLSPITFLSTKMTSTTYKSIALKVLVLWNLPALLLLAGAFQVGTFVIV